ncbi:hypothetical protein BJ546DRAFT_948569 [Cryomyces antarcticus]
MNEAFELRYVRALRQQNKPAERSSDTKDAGKRLTASQPVTQDANSDESMRNNAEQEFRSRTPVRPVSSDAAEPMEKLSLGHVHETGSLASPPKKSEGPEVAPINRRKRVSSDVQSSEPLGQFAESDSQWTPRHTGPTRGDCDDASFADPDFSRDSVAHDEFGRPKSSRRKLFDPKGGGASDQAQETRAVNPTILAKASASFALGKQVSGFSEISRQPNKTHRNSGLEATYSRGHPNKKVMADSAEQRSNPPSQHTPGVFLQAPAEVRYPNLIMQPDSRPISQEQLAAEVKGIYAGLVMVEAKCINIDKAQASANHEAGPGQQPKLGNDHWQALIALHRTLLHEHHDFLLASQHPSASPALRRLAAKYSMPARMWRHGIHSFLELLRRRLPESLEYMLAFIYLAYQMMALLYETVPAFEETWIECLGDLGRYRMAIEDGDLRDREVWGGVARFWYTKAADKSPTVGRLYHHLAILARPNALQQFYFYSRSLTCVQPFRSARESILTLFDPILGRSQPAYSRSHPLDASFIKAHGILFARVSMEKYDETINEYLSQLDGHIGRATAKWKEQGVYIIVANIAALFEYGSEDSTLCRAYQQKIKQLQAANRRADGADPLVEDALQTIGQPTQESQMTIDHVARLMFPTLTVALRRLGDRNVLPHIHVFLIFLSSLTKVDYAMDLLQRSLPWRELVFFLNTLARSEQVDSRLESASFLLPEEGASKPLPEDYLVRGMVFSQWLFPPNWFQSTGDDEERLIELASTNKSRAERILWLGIRIASASNIPQLGSFTC